MVCVCVGGGGMEWRGTAGRRRRRRKGGVDGSGGAVNGWLVFLYFFFSGANFGLIDCGSSEAGTTVVRASLSCGLGLFLEKHLPWKPV